MTQNHQDGYKTLVDRKLLIFKNQTKEKYSLLHIL